MNATQKRRLELTRVGGAIAIPKILRDLGADANAVIDAAALQPETLTDSENVIPFTALGHLLQRCVEATHVEHMGLLLGQNSSTASLGYLGLLVENSPNVRAALDNLIRHFHIHDGRGVPILDISQGTASLGYAIFENSVPAAMEIIDGAVASLFNVMRRLCGSSWHPIEVRLPRSKPRSTKPFDSFFEVPVRFGTEHGIVVFSSDWLMQPVSDANSLIRRLVEDRIGQIEAEMVDSLEGQLRRLLRSLVLTRRCSLESVAQLFALEPRTFARRLEREEIKFRSLIDDARYEVARHLLADTSLAMTQVAAMLDYSEASAFSRAFRRWSGKTPVAWRADRFLRDHKRGGLGDG